jgi:enterochelin esterase-like enzyme
MSINIAEDIRSVTYLKRRTREILDLIHQTDRSVERTVSNAMKRSCLLFLLAAIAAVAGFAQPPQSTPPQPVLSPEVHSDRRVTFRFRNPNAKEVSLAREGAQPVPMQKDEQGVWSVTIDALEPDLYGYSFVADGVRLIDPSNSLIKPNLLNIQNVVHVPGPSSLPWEINPVPHGIVHHQFYRSKIVGDDRDFFVYTPPRYDPSSGQRYPTLYLLHGFSDDASGWTAVGRAHVILDNLIAQGKIKPMIVVMPLGYGAPEMVSRGLGAFRDQSLRQRNFARFSEALISEVMPAVETAYRVSKDRALRAIAGLSMGGAESLLTGLNHLEQFAWVGAFSSGGLGDDFAAAFPSLDAKSSSRLRLLWIACGVDDRLIDDNRKLRDWLKSKEVRHSWIETPGAHTWMLWRRNLAEFASLLFRDNTQ